MGEIIDEISYNWSDRGPNKGTCGIYHHWKLKLGTRENISYGASLREILELALSLLGN